MWQDDVFYNELRRINELQKERKMGTGKYEDNGLGEYVHVSIPTFGEPKHFEDALKLLGFLLYKRHAEQIAQWQIDHQPGRFTEFGYSKAS